MEQTFETLTKHIKSASNIIIMTHKYPDFDGLGAAFCLQAIINQFNIESCIVDARTNKNKALKKAFKLLNEYNIDFKASLSNFDINDNTLLIILDTHKSSMVENEKLLDKVKNRIVIDHHIKSKDYLKNNTLTYINSNLSSTVEFMASYMNYLNVKIHPLLATFMLVGLEIDTNSYNLKTTAKTHISAAYIIESGADNILKQILLKDTKANYLKRKKIIEKSTMINDKMALCVADRNTYTKVDLATIAEELLQFENVEASFSIAKIGTNLVGISARSIGKINVEQIMRELNGGGHYNEAATQLNCTVKEAERTLRKIIGGLK